MKTASGSVTVSQDEINLHTLAHAYAPFQIMNLVAASLRSPAHFANYRSHRKPDTLIPSFKACGLCQTQAFDRSFS